MSNFRYMLFATETGYPQPENNFGYIKKTYDASEACLTCGTGLKQTAPFRFKNEIAKSPYDIVGLNWVHDVVFIRENLKQLFEEHHISGIDISQPVIHKTGLPVAEFYQIHVKTILKGGIDTSNLKSEVCAYPDDPSQIKFLTAIKSKLVTGPFCGRVKYNFPQGENRLRVRSEVFENQPDFLCFETWFGSGGASMRPVIITEKVKTLIEENNYRGADFHSIELI